MSQIPSWSNKCRLWRTQFESTLDAHYRVYVQSLPIIVSFKEMGGVAGMYVYAPNAFHEIRMSPHLTEEEARITYGHEYAHFLTIHFYGDNSHSFLWRTFMSLFGLPAEEFHTIPLTTRCTMKNVEAALASAALQNGVKDLEGVEEEPEEDTDNSDDFGSGDED